MHLLQRTYAQSAPHKPMPWLKILALEAAICMTSPMPVQAHMHIYAFYHKAQAEIGSVCKPQASCVQATGIVCASHRHRV